MYNDEEFMKFCGKLVVLIDCVYMCAQVYVPIVNTCRFYREGLG